MKLVTETDTHVLIEMSKNDWRFIRGACGAADSEGWPYRDDNYEETLATYARIDSIDIEE